MRTRFTAYCEHCACDWRYNASNGLIAAEHWAAFARTMNNSTLDEARNAKTRLMELLRDHPHVTGVGIMRVGEGYAIKVNFAAAQGDAQTFPTEIDGVPICVEVTGKINPLRAENA